MVKRIKQQLLGLVAPPKRDRRFADRGFGVEETPWQRDARLARSRAIHEQTKANSDAADVLKSVKLRRMS